MALVDTVWYVNAGDQSTTGHYAVAKRPQNTAVTAGQLVRQFTAPTVGSERVFVCIVAGTTANVTDATWVVTRGAKTTDGTATWQECTGQCSLNGDLTNTTTWAAVKAATPAVLGQVIKRSNNASYQICTTAGAMSASEPTFSDTAGVTTTDTTAVWTSLGAVGNFTGGQAPFARLASVFGANWFTVGGFLTSDTVYVGNNHAESQSTAITISLGESDARIIRVLCHNGGAYPPTSANLTTGAVVSTTGNSAITISIAAAPGSCYFYGLTLRPGVGASGTAIINLNGNTYSVVFESCSFELASTGAGSLINVGNLTWPGNVTFSNVTVKFASTSQSIQLGMTNWFWQKTGQVLVSGSSVPTNFIKGGNVDTTITVLEALDLSQLTGNIVNITDNSFMGQFLIKDCKLHATGAIVTPLFVGTTVQLVRSSSGAPAYTSARYSYEGTETTETTIVRSGGATDPAGQAQSRKIVTSANVQWLRPFKAEPYAVWNATTGAGVTATVYGVGSSLPLNDEIWAEFEYLGSGSTTLGTIVTTTKSDVLATGASVASDGSTWGGGTTPFKLVATFTPGQTGYIHARIRAAKASSTYYIDPQVYLS